jgi:hypothetical protein
MGGNVFPPEYGVPLSADELNSNIPTSILYGVTPSNEFIPIQINSAGALAISGTISVGTVTIEGEDPVDSSTHPIAVVNFTPDGYALRTAIFDEGNLLKVNADGSINVNTGGSSGTPVNKYAENIAVPSSTLTIIVSYTVPAGKTLSIIGMYGWGTSDGEFAIKVDSVFVGGGWSSPSFRTLHLDYESAPVLANAGQVVTVNVTQYYASTQDFKANLLGQLN